MTREKDLKQIHDEIKSCKKCALHETRLNAVPGEGPVNAKVMFIGEAPGAKEDETGRPFVGRSGKLLRSLIAEAGLAEDEVFITSILKSRPPKNRTPKKSESEACMPYLERQIETINPQVIVLVGGVAISNLIGPWKLADAHGRFYEGKGRTYFMSYHPAAALRNPELKDVMRADFEKLKKDLR
ncbi:MAG: uracil-DNA glycosylase [Candidatus Thorarchaeota archaeon]|nr:uracil-DNA glycosylase [Candidatus Thorarchaeota archaeon]